MYISSYRYENGIIIPQYSNQLKSDFVAQLVLVFGQKQLIVDSIFNEQLKAYFPNAIIALTSTSGEIIQETVCDNSIVITALCMERTTLQAYRISIRDYSDSYAAGFSLSKYFATKDLAYIMLLSDGSLVNGSLLIKGFNENIDSRIPITGGLAGDGTNFNDTVVGLNNIPSEGEIIAIGFYGDALRIGHASIGGWEMFGPKKTITKSDGNILYEIDHKNTLEVYKEYLGKYAADLPSAALLFPLSIQNEIKNQELVRTILRIDNEKDSLIFAGDVPMNTSFRFMKANFDKLIDAASNAAILASTFHAPIQPQYVLRISCVGRKIILNNRIDEEVEAVVDSLNKNSIVSGFYSYGELSPFNQSSSCQLHNQTITITTFAEIE